jgi:hypothetical protein
MYRKFKDRFGTAGVVLGVIAIVLAIGGSALAASGLNGKQKKEVKGIAKSFQGTGPAGAQGAPGSPGAAGAKGDNGTNGTTGTPGADGKTVLNGTTVPAAGLGNNGDFYIRTSTDEIYGPKTAGAWGTATELKGEEGEEGEKGEKGEEGSPWVAGQAPSGVTLKGTWSVHSSSAAADELIPLSISTGVPVGTIAFGVYVAVADQNDPNNAGGCTGTAANPTPTTFPGAVCFYEDASTNLTGWPLDGTAAGVDSGHLGGGGGGNVWQVKATAAGLVDAYGSWAMVTE